MNEQQTTFLKLVTPPALEVEKASSIAAPVTIAQAILESGWGKSGLTLHANNFFGIKFSHRIGTEDYGEYLTQTREFVKGKATVMQAGFVLYPNALESFRDHARLLCGPRYAEFFYYSSRWCHGGAPESQIYHRDLTLLAHACDALGPRLNDQDRDHCGYSTNPEYGALLMKLIGEFGLEDGEALAALAQWSVVSGQSSVAGNTSTPLPTDVSSGDL